MNKFLKVSAVFGLIAAAVVIAAPQDFFMEAHYDESLTDVLNNQPYRPDWNGPAPLYYKNKGIPGEGTSRIFVGAGDPGYWSDKVIIFEALSEGSAINGGRSTLVVMYDPKTKKYKAYSWREKAIFGKLGSSLVADYDAETLPLKVFKGSLSGEKFKLANDSRSEIGPVSITGIRGERLSALNEQYR